MNYSQCFCYSHALIVNESTPSDRSDSRILQLGNISCIKTYNRSVEDTLILCDHSISELARQDCFAYCTTSQSHLNCLCVCKPLTNAHNPVSLKDAIWPFTVTALMEMNRTSMVRSVLIQWKLLCRLNWVNLDLCFLSLPHCNSALKGLGDW